MASPPSSQTSSISGFSELSDIIGVYRSSVVVDEVRTCKQRCGLRQGAYHDFLLLHPLRCGLIMFRFKLLYHHAATTFCKAMGNIETVLTLLSFMMQQSDLSWQNWPDIDLFTTTSDVSGEGDDNHWEYVQVDYSLESLTSQSLEHIVTSVTSRDELRAMLHRFSNELDIEVIDPAREQDSTDTGNTLQRLVYYISGDIGKLSRDWLLFDRNCVTILRSLRPLAGFYTDIPTPSTLTEPDIAAMIDVLIAWLADTEERNSPNGEMVKQTMQDIFHIQYKTASDDTMT